MSDVSYSIVLIHYAPAHTTENLVRTLADWATSTVIPPEEIVVFSNGSPDEIRERLPSVSYRDSQTNLGFGVAANKVVDELSSATVLIINPDLELHLKQFEAFVRAALSRLSQEPQLLCVSPHVEFMDGLQAVDGPRPTILTMLSPLKHSGLRHSLDLEENFVDNLTMVCPMFRRSNFVALGGFDERYFLYFEDADLCRRGVSAGLTMKMLPYIIGRHLRGHASESQSHAARIKVIRTSQARYVNRWYRWGGRTLFSVLLLASAMEQALRRRASWQSARGIAWTALQTTWTGSSAN